MRKALLLSLVILGACSDEPTEAERQAAVAEVVQAQEAPPLAFGPQAIGYPDIEKNNLYGAGCSFVPDGGGLGAVALAMAEEGYMKRDGEIMRFAADKGSKELPYLAHGQYDGRDFAFSLTLRDVEGKEAGEEAINYPATLAVTDSKERVVYQAEGIAQCGA